MVQVSHIMVIITTTINTRTPTPTTTTITPAASTINTPVTARWVVAEQRPLRAVVRPPPAQGAAEWPARRLRRWRLQRLTGGVRPRLTRLTCPRRRQRPPWPLRPIRPTLHRLRRTGKAR